MTIVNPLILIVFLNSIFSCNVFSKENYTEYYRLIHIANKQKKAKNYDSAYSNYMVAFGKVKYIHKKNLESAIEVSKKIGKDSVVKALRHQLVQSEKNINKNYVYQIEKLFDADQMVRSKKYRKAQSFYLKCLRDTLCEKHTAKFNAAKLRCEKWRAIDSSNIHQLIKLINENGFPSEKMVGLKASENAFILMLHFDYDIENKILGMYLNSALSTGEISPRNYAQIIDRRLLNQKKNSLYFVIPFGYDNLTKEQREEVDLRRVAIGLNSVSESQIIIKKKHSIRVIYTND